jgi:hypothetical protein
MFINNKYKKWHDSIIDRAKNRVLSCYIERHHIIPKSCGGSNDKDNLVPLTAREHFIIHLLLTKCVIKKYKFKMIKALLCMSKMKTKYVKRDFNYSSKLYEINKIKYSNYMKLNNPSFNKETREKISKTKTGKKQPISFVIKMKNKKLSDKTKQKISNSLIGNKRRFNVIIPLEQRKEQSKFMKGNKFNLGNKASEETKLKMSLAHKKRWSIIKENRSVA